MVLRNGAKACGNIPELPETLTATTVGALGALAV